VSIEPQHTIALRSTESPPALRYLLPRDESCWRWSADAAAVEWRDGRTIGFREEVFAIVRRLAPGGLPPLGAIVLLLAATRDNWGNHADNTERILAGYAQPSGKKGSPQLLIGGVVSRRARQELTDVLGDLESVAALPPELRGSAPAVRALTELVFAGAPTELDAQQASEVVELITAGVEPELLQRSSGSDENYAHLSVELEALAAGLDRAGVEPLTQWMRTGIERTVEPADIELPPAARVRSLVAELKGDAELGGLARLAHDLLAAIHLPRALRSPEDLPVGGVSDIANRGPLDRLLISELAHDDLTLAVRVALGEALYLRRESPAKHPPVGRAVLVDCGIRTWGVPRLFATAVAMALVAGSDPRGSLSIHRARGARVDRVDLTTRAGLLAHLEALATAPHPGESLRAWTDSIDLQRTDADEHDAEAFIVTHEDVLDDAQFRRQLSAVGEGREWHVATVSRDGSFVLWLITSAGRRQLCRAELDLDEILAPPPQEAAPSALLISADAKLPVILNVQPLPLLLPAQVEAHHAVFSEKLGLVAISGDRRLLRWHSAVKGAAQLAPSLPAGRILGVFGDDEHGLVHVVIVGHKENKIHLVTADLNTGRCHGSQHARNHPLHCYFRDGLIFLVYKREVRAILPRGGGERVTALRDGVDWISGRFFRTPRGIAALSGDGLGFQHVTSRNCRLVFDRAAHGPWLLLPDGDVAPADGDPLGLNKRFALDPSVRAAAASADGNRVAMTVVAISRGRATEGGTYVLDLNKDKPRWVHVDKLQRPLGPFVAEDVSWSTQASITARHHFAGVFRAESGETLALRTPQGFTAIDTNSKGDLYLRDVKELRPDLPAARIYRPFERAAPPEGARFNMRLATWGDGSRAYLDTRGMLHLVSSDRRLPQLTLTLSTAPIAGWSSNGQTFGWAYFLESAPTSEPAVALEILRQFCARLR
jgi:hypothetical protein